MSQVRMAETKRSRRALWPVVGLLLIISMGVLAYFLAPVTIAFLEANLPNFTARGMRPEHLQLVVTAILFVVFVGLVGVIIAIFAPKRAMNIKYSDLAKEREEIVAQQRRKKVEARVLAQKMREDLKRLDGEPASKKKR